VHNSQPSDQQFSACQRNPGRNNDVHRPSPTSLKPFIPTTSPSPLHRHLLHQSPVSPNRQKKFKRPAYQHFKLRAERTKSSTSTPSISSQTSSLSSVKNVLSSWVGSLRAGVLGAWIKARREYVASQEGRIAWRDDHERIWRCRGGLMRANSSDELGRKRPVPWWCCITRSYMRRGR
jgi:hypothetical protein